MRRLPPLNALRSFEAAARLGSFNKAADELFVTPSAVSHQIKSLEEFLGISLFRREKRRSLLTAAGEKYLSAVEHALDEIDIATRRLIASPNTSAVNISVAPAFLTRWLVPRIRDFQQVYPDVELRLSASNGPVDFFHSDTDMAIYFGYGEWDEVESHFLRGVTLMPVCSPKLLEGGKPLNTPQDLRHHTLLHVSSRPEEWQQILKKAGLPRSGANRGVTFSSTSLAMSAAMEGAGIALADIGLVEREVEYGQLIIPFEFQFKTRKAFYLVFQEGRQLTYGMQAFKEWIFDQMDSTDTCSP
jgi:LysR family glycine cleavage system transcriptional activator